MDQNEIIDNRNFSHLTEQIRLSYAHLLKMYMQFYKKYEQFKKKFNDDESKKCLPSVELYFYDVTGKINWNNIQALMPRDIEKSIKKEYDVLSENEIRLCCLLLFEVSVNDITYILPYTQRSIHSITHRIKQKTGINDIKLIFKKIVVVREN